MPPKNDYHPDLGLAIVSLIIVIFALIWITGRVRHLGQSAIAGTLRLKPEEYRRYVRATVSIPLAVLVGSLLGLYVSVVPSTRPWQVGMFVLIFAFFATMAIPLVPPAKLPRFLRSILDADEKRR